MANTKLIYPFPVFCNITCDWKSKVEFPVKSGKFITHSGQDFSYRQLQSIKKMEGYAMADGVVIETKPWGARGSLGNGMQVYYYSEDTTVLYLHSLLQYKAKVGDKVTAGQLLFTIGNPKGMTMAGHVHIQYEKGKTLSTGLMKSTTQNPYNYTKRMVLKSAMNEVVETNLPVATPEENSQVVSELRQKVAELELANNAYNQIVIERNKTIDQQQIDLNKAQQDRASAEELLKQAQKQTEEYRVYIRDMQGNSLLFAFKLIAKYVADLLTGKLKKE